MKFYTSNGDNIINTNDIDAYGKVGIGIGPQERLHVKGDSIFEDDNYDEPRNDKILDYLIVMLI